MKDRAYAALHNTAWENMGSRLDYELLGRLQANAGMRAVRGGKTWRMGLREIQLYREYDGERIVATYRLASHRPSSSHRARDDHIPVNFRATKTAHLQFRRKRVPLLTKMICLRSLRTNFQGKGNKSECTHTMSE